VVGLLFFFFEEKVVAVFCRALQHVRILVSDLLPLKLLAPLHLLACQQRLQVWQRDGQLALRLRTQYGQLLVFYARGEPRVDALDVINVAADAQCKHLCVVVSKQSLLTDLAHILLRLLSLALLNSFQLFHQLFLGLSRSLLL